MNILLKNIDIITADEAMKVVRKGSIGISGGMIEFVMEAGEDTGFFKADKVINGANKLAMPGLVNAHTHSPMTLLRNFADDLSLEDWLFKKVFPAEARLGPEDVYWGSMLGMAEMIRSGTTAFADMYFHMDGVAEAVCQAGIRANLSISPLRFVQGDPIDETRTCYDYHRKWSTREESRIKVSLEVHSVYLFNEQNLRDAAALAKELGIGIQIHVLETETERRQSMERYGMNSAEICLECGIFDVPVIAAHCVHTSDSDMEILREKRVHVAHNPTSNLKLGSGIAKVPDMLSKGINVCLGTDGAASNNNLDMFEEMNLAALIHKGANRNPTLVGAADAVRMATVNGAKALGFENETGCIRKGMRADIIILDTEKPHLCPVNNPVSAAVYSAHGMDVETVIVDGNILMEGRELKTIDEELIRHKAGKTAQKILGM